MPESAFAQLQRSSVEALIAMNLNLIRVSREEIAPVEEYSDYTVCQTEPWIRFLEETQGAEPVYAQVVLGRRVIGRFTGLLVSRFGIPILGSPIRGWSTSYMGFNLKEDVSRLTTLRALTQFAFAELRCMHLELFDRHLSADELASSGYKFVPRHTFEIDLTKSHDQLLASMTQGCRRNIRKAERAGVQVEVATDYDFASQYFEQLGDVFSKQRLARPYGIERVAGLLRNMLPHGNLLLLRALNPNGHCVATGIFPTANKTMYFWGGASWREHHHLRPNQILHWVAIMCAKARGIERYDMGGGGDYKRQYGGRQIAVPWVTVSKYPGLHLLRSCARLAWDIRQRALGIAGTFTGRLP